MTDLVLPKANSPQAYLRQSRKKLRIRRNLFHCIHRNRLRSLHTPVWAKPPVTINITPAKAPYKEGPISGTVLLVENGKFFSYIKYNYETIELVGRLMPFGVSYFKPAYFKVVWRPKQKVYDVFCGYVNDPYLLLLWRTELRPAWISNPQTVKDA